MHGALSKLAATIIVSFSTLDFPRHNQTETLPTIDPFPHCGPLVPAIVNSENNKKGTAQTMSYGPVADEPSLVAKLETDLTTGRAIADHVAERFAPEDIAVSLVDAGGSRWQVAIHFRELLSDDAVRAAVRAAAGTAAVAALQISRVEAADWVRQSLAGLKPVTAGRFIVHGAHDRTRAPANCIGIEIEAALAFGTGHHGTTRGCLLALDAICKAVNRRQRTPRILDVGTGSGVLAIAAARALRARVLATDIDASAVHAARENIRRNRAGGLVTVAAADGVGAHAIRVRAPFDLILANILLDPLRRMAAPLRRLAALDGRIVLSGILRSQANAVIAAYRPLALTRRRDVDGWTTLVFARRTPGDARLPLRGRPPRP
jgi:ribosomal protein L11 methyltransferase